MIISIEFAHSSGNIYPSTSTFIGSFARNFPLIPANSHSLCQRRQRTIGFSLFVWVSSS